MNCDNYCNNSNKNAFPELHHQLVYALFAGSFAVGGFCSAGSQGRGSHKPTSQIPTGQGPGAGSSAPCKCKGAPRGVERAGNVADGGTSLVTTGKG